MARRLHLWDSVFYDGGVWNYTNAIQDTADDDDGVFMLIVLQLVNFTRYI
jgi:hypothetical protein